MERPKFEPDYIYEGININWIIVIIILIILITLL